MNRKSWVPAGAALLLRRAGAVRPVKPKTWLVAGGALAATVLAVLAIFVHSSAGGSSESTSGDPPATAKVERGRLALQVSATGTLTYAAQGDGSAYSVVNQATGVLTALPSVGDVIMCGQVLYRVHGHPVPLLCGRTPLYRRLSQGMKGWDVKELNGNLAELGYADGAELDPSGYFGSGTRSALKDLKGDLGLAPTGTLDPEQAVVLPGPLRISSVSATLGAPAQRGGSIAQATSTGRRVEVDLEPSQAEGVKIGDRASITLPNNRTTPGVVGRIGTLVVDDGSDSGSSSDSGSGSGSGSSSSGGSGSGTATVPVFIKLKQVRDVRGIQQAPVQVSIITGRVTNALSVPVTALLARPGGYAVETVDAGGERHLVPVELGAFDDANGVVEVRGPGVRAGQRVVVPAS
jgi:peptidoglycan hydrolase-like protein with peptidoglycan-binding domain